MSGESDVVVVGGGAIGAAIALELALRGARPIVLESGPALGAGCSAGNAGLICPSHSAPLATPAALRQGFRLTLKPDSPLYLRPRPAVVPWLVRFVAACTTPRAEAATRLIRELSVASLELHAALAAQGLETGFERRGLLNAYETEAALAAGGREAKEYAETGLRAEILGARDARALEPALGPRVLGGILYPDEAHCDPLRFVEAVGRAAVEAGAEVRTGVEVLGFHRSDGRVTEIATTAGGLRAGTVVLAAGAWTPRVARDLGLFVPVEGGKGYHLELENGRGDPQLPVFLQEARVIATPFPGRLRLAGTLELAGLDLGVSGRRVQAVRASAERVLPDLAGRRVLRIWRGLRPCAPDGLPIVGRPPEVPNVVLATGHAMMGLTLAPITGRLVAQLIAGERPSHDLRRLDPARFRPLLAARTRRR